MRVVFVVSDSQDLAMQTFKGLSISLPGLFGINSVSAIDTKLLPFSGTSITKAHFTNINCMLLAGNP